MSNDNYKLPCLSRHDFSVLIDDILTLENYSIDENTQTSLNQLKHNLVISCLIAQTIVRDNKISPKTIEKLQTKFKLEIFKTVECNKKNLNKLPKLLQLPFLISRSYLNPHEIMWAKIAIYLGIVLRHHKLKSYFNRIIQRIKVACFFQTPIKTWILKNLPNIGEPYDLAKADLLQINNLIEYLIALEKTTTNKTQHNQAIEMRLCLEVALNPKRRKKIDREIKKLEGRKKPKNKPVKQKPNELFTQPIFHINQAFNATDDIENNLVNTQAYCFELKTENDTVPSSQEIKADNTGDRLLQYQQYIPPAVRHSMPLQVVGLSLQQMYISQRELALNSSVYLLSPKAYRCIFTKLIEDSQLNAFGLSREQLKRKTLASVLLTSMITAIPIESLIQRGFIRQSGLFIFLTKSVYLSDSLNITKRKHKFDPTIFENEKDSIELPLPLKLIGFLANRRLLPKQAEIREYIREIRTALSLPYFSVHRTESALHTILSRYIKGSNSHIADLICRIPPETAPAKFYSSHSIDEIINHYKNALVWLRQDTDFDLKFLEHKKTYTTGSGQALTLPFIKQLLGDMFDKLVMTSFSKTLLFNHVSCYVWLIFCLTTGIRPNNHITNIHDIDLDDEHAQILISDKPNRAVRNPRLVPICPTLICTLNLYRLFLSRFSQIMHQSKWINQRIKPILQQHDNSDSMLINLIHEQDEKIRTIKRGQIYQIIKPFFDIDPYFTRHFMRTQLEKRGVAMPLINAVIGHEKNRQEFFGKFSSGAKADLGSISGVFERIANDLELDNIDNKFKQIESLLRVLPETLETTVFQGAC